MPTRHTVFVKDAQALEKTLCGLKSMACLFCGRVGTLNRHSRIEGNDAGRVDGRVHRGHRVYCSNRGRRGGCGRTFPMRLAAVLPRHTFSAALLWAVLVGLLDRRSIQAAWQTAGRPLTLETTYHLIQRLRRRLSDVRVALARLIPPPAGLVSDPLLQTLEHLRAAFPASPCPVAAFQERVQRPLLTG
jgi:hypothetical protein